MLVEGSEYLTELAGTVAQLEEARFNQLLDECLTREIKPLQIIEAMSAGMEQVGRLYNEGEYFLAELVYSGEVFKSAMNRVKPLLGKTEEVPKSGRIVMGTVKDDIHDLGKNIVATMLDCSGFDVIDLGVDVPSERFVEAIRANEPDLVGMSILLTTAFGSLEKTIADIGRAGLREKVRIMIGGAVANERIRKQMNADFVGQDAPAAVEIARKTCSR